MPGFVVNGLGSGAPSTVTPYYKYTWEIVQIYGDHVEDDSPLIYVINATLPSWTIDKERVQGASLEYKFAKSISWDDIKITWYDTIGMAKIMRDWRGSVWTPDGGMQPSNDYKKQSILRSLDFSWNNPVDWQLNNCWPTTVRSSDLTYAESDVKQIDVTVSYDWAEEILADLPGM